jgi:hypothetical protein
MKRKPEVEMSSAKSRTPSSGAVPPLMAAPSDFSAMLVSPPALFPGDGLSSKLPPKRPTYSLYHAIEASSFSPMARVRARRVRHLVRQNRRPVAVRQA